MRYEQQLSLMEHVALAVERLEPKLVAWVDAASLGTLHLHVGVRGAGKNGAADEAPLFVFDMSDEYWSADVYAPLEPNDTRREWDGCRELDVPTSTQNTSVAQAFVHHVAKYTAQMWKSLDEVSA